MKKTLLLLGAALVAALALAAAVARWAPPAEPFYLGGIQVNEADHAVWLDTLDAEGFNTVAVTVYAKQGDWDSANLWWEEEEPWVVAEMRSAKARGLKVVLVLRVALDHAFPANEHLWHGMIQPIADADLEEWFWRYRRFVAEWAEIAEAEGVDVLAVGSELSSLTNTVPVDAVPALEEYWANPEKVARERARLLAVAAGETFDAEAFDEEVLRTTDSEETDSGATTAGSAPGAEDELRAAADDGPEPEPRAEAGVEHDAPGAAGELADPELAPIAARIDANAAAHGAWARRVAWLDDIDPVARINERRRRLEDGWRGVVDTARTHYSGTLTYAANFDQYKDVAFWDALDMVSINAYFPLLKRLPPAGARAELGTLFRARWRGILGGIEAFLAERGLGGRRVLFSEIGYTARVHAGLEPWAAAGESVVATAEGQRLVDWSERPTDVDERAWAVRALYDAHLDLGGDLLAGLLYWKLSTEPAHRLVEPFVLLIGERVVETDPLLAELQRFSRRLPWDRRLALVERALGAGGESTSGDREPTG